MSPTRGLNEAELDLNVRYARGSDETVTDAVVDAFLAANMDVFDQPTVLDDWINTDVFEDVSWTTDRLLYLCVLIWDRPVVITPEEIRIFATTERELIPENPPNQ